MSLHGLMNRWHKKPNRAGYGQQVSKYHSLMTFASVSPCVLALISFHDGLMMCMYTLQWSYIGTVTETQTKSSPNKLKIKDFASESLKCLYSLRSGTHYLGFPHKAGITLWVPNMAVHIPVSSERIHEKASGEEATTLFYFSSFSHRNEILWSGPACPWQ